MKFAAIVTFTAVIFVAAAVVLTVFLVWGQTNLNVNTDDLPPPNWGPLVPVSRTPLPNRAPLPELNLNNAATTPNTSPYQCYNTQLNWGVRLNTAGIFVNFIRKDVNGLLQNMQTIALNNNLVTDTHTNVTIQESEGELVATVSLATADTSGRLFTFINPTGEVGDWAQSQTYSRHPAPVANDGFGKAFALLTDVYTQRGYFCVATDNGITVAGAIQVFRNGLFVQSVEPAEIVSPLLGFADVLQVSQNLLLASCPGLDSVFRFFWDSTGTSAGMKQVEIISGGSGFGTSLVLNASGDQMVVGAPGLLTLMNLDTTGTWQVQDTVSYADVGLNLTADPDLQCVASLQSSTGDVVLFRVIQDFPRPVITNPTPLGLNWLPITTTTSIIVDLDYLNETLGVTGYNGGQFVRFDQVFQ